MTISNSSGAVQFFIAGIESGIRQLFKRLVTGNSKRNGPAQNGGPVSGSDP